MYDYNITAQEISDYNADMMELAGTQYQPTDEEMEEMHAYFCIEYGQTYQEFATYREAEIYCGEHGIHPENIYELG